MYKNISKYILLILILTYSFFPSFTFAQTANTPQLQDPVQNILRVTPIITDLQLIPGKQMYYNITIDNLLPQPLGIQTSLQNFVPTDENNEITVQHTSPLLSWTTISDQSFIIPQGKHKTITVMIHPPKDVKTGGYYAVVFFTPFYTRIPNPHVPVVLSKVGALLLGTVGNLNYHDLATKVTVPVFSFPLLNRSSGVDLILRVHNNYFTHFSAKPMITITPLFGQPQTITLTEKHILPQTTRAWIQSVVIQNPTYLLYTAQLSLSVGGGTVINKTTNFFIIPQQLFILVCILFLALVFFLMRKRILKAVHILITHNS